MFCERGWLVRRMGSKKGYIGRRWLGNPSMGDFAAVGAKGSRGMVQGVSSRYLGWDSPGIKGMIFNGEGKQFWRLYPKSTVVITTFPLPNCHMFLFCSNSIFSSVASTVSAGIHQLVAFPLWIRKWCDEEKYFWAWTQVGPELGLTALLKSLNRRV